MTAGSDLRADHRVIRRLESALRVIAARIAKGERLPPKDVEEAIALMAEFVDSYHHAKEEAGLFPVVQGISKDQQKVVYGFLVEHEFGRRAARRIQEEFAVWAKDGSRAEPLSRFILTYADFIKVHTTKEDVWFVTVDKGLLTPARQDVVLERFATLEGKGVRKRFEGRVSRLSAKYMR